MKRFSRPNEARGYTDNIAVESSMVNNVLGYSVYPSFKAKTKTKFYLVFSLCLYEAPIEYIILKNLHVYVYD